MGKIVSINAGSTSIKMAIFDDFAILDGQTTPLAEYRWEKDVKKATVKFGVHKHVHEDVPFEKHADAFIDGINCFKEAKSFTDVKEIVAVVNRATGRSADIDYINKNFTKLNRFTDVNDSSKWYFADVNEAANEHIGITTSEGETWTK